MRRALSVVDMYGIPVVFTIPSLIKTGVDVEKIVTCVQCMVLSRLSMDVKKCPRGDRCDMVSAQHILEFHCDDVGCILPPDILSFL